MRRFDFPLLKEITFLDSGAGTLKPIPVINKIVEYYTEYPLNMHSIDSELGVKLYEKFIDARKTVADLVDAIPEEVIFTSGTTDGLNRLARMFETFINKGDKIVVSQYNHSSNATPWVALGKRTGAEVIFSDNLFDDIDEKTKIVAYSQINNSINQEIDPDELATKVEEMGALLVNDAAQAINSTKVSLDNSDVITISGTKIYGPTGVGALIIKKELLSLLKPTTYGGGAVVKYSENNIIFKDSIAAFEAGSLNAAGILGMAEGIKYMNKYDDFDRKKDLSEFAYNELKKLGNIKILSQPRDVNVLFTVEGYEAQDVVSYLGHRKIILRAGKHCALYIYDKIGVPGAIRMSFGLYNNEDDILKVIEAIKNGGDFIEGL